MESLYLPWCVAYTNSAICHTDVGRGRYEPISSVYNTQLYLPPAPRLDPASTDTGRGSDSTSAFAALSPLLNSEAIETKYVLPNSIGIDSHLNVFQTVRDVT
eukprot:COSAG02_NODE_3753_length_6282_cov_25.845221_5_plen_102_part_00